MILTVEMSNSDRYVLPVGKAAEILGISVGYLHNFDAELKPMRDRFRRRWYCPEDVHALAAARAAARAAMPSPIAPLTTR